MEPVDNNADVSRQAIPGLRGFAGMGEVENGWMVETKRWMDASMREAKGRNPASVFFVHGYPLNFTDAWVRMHNDQTEGSFLIQPPNCERDKHLLVLEGVG